MATHVSLFSTSAPLSPKDAPNRVIEKHIDEECFEAVLHKRCGVITPADFLMYANRSCALCDQIYMGTVLELRLDRYVGYGRQTFCLAEDYMERERGDEIKIHQLTFASFKDIFGHATSVVLIIRPGVLHEDTSLSYAMITWISGRPKALFFYAQQNKCRGLTGNRTPLQHLLLRKMFYVPGSAPSINFAVKLGSIAVKSTLYGAPI